MWKFSKKEVGILKKITSHYVDMYHKEIDEEKYSMTFKKYCKDNHMEDTILKDIPRLMHNVEKINTDENINELPFEILCTLNFDVWRSHGYTSEDVEEALKDEKYIMSYDEYYFYKKFFD